MAHPTAHVARTAAHHALAAYVVAGVDWQVIPDYEVLLARLEERLGTSLNVVLLDAIPPESAEAARADCGTSVHVLLLSCSSS